MARRGLPGPAGRDEGLLDHVPTARAVPDAEWIWDEGRGAGRVVTDADDAPWTSGDVSVLCEHPDDLDLDADTAVSGPSPYERHEEQQRARQDFERWLAEDADDDERRRVRAVVAERAASHAAGVHAHRLRAHQAAVGRAQGPEPPDGPSAGPDTGPSAGPATGPDPPGGGSTAPDTFHGRHVQQVHAAGDEEPDDSPPSAAHASPDATDLGAPDAHDLVDDLLLAPEADSPAPCTDGTCSPVSPSGRPVTSVGGGRYTPPAALARVVRRRWGRCTHPGCRQRATACDLDDGWVRWSARWH